VVIVGFSLLAYIALQNWHTAIARALIALLFGVVIVFGGTVLLNAPPTRESTIQTILRAQWLGVALVPAGYIHLSAALLDYIGHHHPRRRWLVWAAYLISISFIALALGTELLVTQMIMREPLAILGAGPLFSLFVVYFGIAGLAALRAVIYVRRTALTTTLRRRFTYLGVTFVAPGLAVFPYLLFGDTVTAIDPALILLGASVRSAGVAIMLVGLVYSIAFQGTLLPDRLVKQDFIRWLLYGPFVGVAIILFLRAVPPLANRLDLPQNILITFGVVILTVLMPIFVARVKPYLDALVYAQDRAEIDYLRQLPRNTFTYADLRVLLENTLLVVCGALRVETGFVAAPDEQQGYTVKSVVGSRRAVRQFVAEHELDDLIREAAAAPRDVGGIPAAEAFVRANGFVLLALRGPDGDLLGAIGVIAPRDGLTPESRKLIGAMAHQMGIALATVQTQQRLFDALRGIGPEMRSLQELTGRLEQATPAALETIETEVALLPEFPQLVKDALGQYWGGPKLSDSPLLELRTVRRVLTEQGGGSPTRALQAVLRQAIENLRPDAQLDPSAQEWVLYNILELRFLQGKRVSDTAERLAMSESDLYRKQRIAVEEVARQLALMEESESRAG
jgi:nitroreductase